LITWIETDSKNEAKILESTKMPFIEKELWIFSKYLSKNFEQYFETKDKRKEKLYFIATNSNDTHFLHQVKIYINIIKKINNIIIKIKLKIIRQNKKILGKID
jgi:hypothetical protein